jgi:hypothetical protein
LDELERLADLLAVIAELDAAKLEGVLDAGAR